MVFRSHQHQSGLFRDIRVDISPDPQQIRGGGVLIDDSYRCLFSKELRRCNIKYEFGVVKRILGKQEWYSLEHDLQRLDYYKPCSPGSIFCYIPMTLIKDFKTNISYTITGRIGNCEMAKFHHDYDNHDETELNDFLTSLKLNAFDASKWYLKSRVRF
ncbi:hypothetical protein GQR58_027555 [Nymphon striatum]|nr:hypothetical protein GQR58_027555 [Nymphon striatum]